MRCEIRGLIRFRSAKGVQPSEIPREIREVYRENTSDRIVRKWVRAFKDGLKNIHGVERSSPPSVV